MKQHPLLQDGSLEPEEAAAWTEWRAADPVAAAEYDRDGDPMELPDPVWRKLNPEEAAEADRFQAKWAAKQAKRLKREARNPERTKEQARDEAQREAMDDEMQEAKTGARQSGESWSDLKDDWINDWLESNWSEEDENDFLDRFNEQWRRDHGADFPNARLKDGTV